jgi:hypothetical protein
VQASFPQRATEEAKTMIYTESEKAFFKYHSMGCGFIALIEE